MKSLYLFLLAVLLCDGLYAQTFSKKYSPTYYTYNSSILTPDGGLLIATNATDSSWMVPRLMRIDSSGGIVWSTQMNLLPEMNRGRFVDIVATYDSCYLAVGQMMSGSTYAGIFMHKFDGNGVAKWSKLITPNSCNASIFGTYESHCVIECKDHGFALSGSTGAAVGNAMFLLKTDSTGNPEWFKAYYDYNDLTFWFRNLCQDADSGFVLFNQYNALNKDAMLVHTDKSGNLLLSATLDSTNNVSLNALFNIDGHVYLCFDNGFIQSNLDTMNFLLRTYTVSQISGYKFKSMEKCRNSDLVLTMAGFQTFGTLRTDSAGVPIWAYAFSSGPSPSDMFERSDGSLMYQGTSQSGTYYTNVILFDSTGSSDCYNSPTAVTSSNVQERLRFTPVMEAACALSVYLLPSNWHDTGTMFDLCPQTYVHPVSPIVVSVFPNPSTGHIQLSGLDMPCTIEVFSIDGKKLISDEVHERLAKLDLSRYEKGVYIIRVVNAGALSIAKIILQ